MNIHTRIPTLYGEIVKKYEETWKNQLEEVQRRFAEEIESVSYPWTHLTDMPIVMVKAGSIIALLQFLKETPGFEYHFLTDITATDEFPREPRFDVVYHLFSTLKHYRLRVKARVSEQMSIPTAVGLWPGANWAEREVYDMFGITFAGHPDLRRILMDIRWEGFPLRKDYPLKRYQLFPDPEPINPELLKNSKEASP